METTELKPDLLSDESALELALSVLEGAIARALEEAAAAEPIPGWLL